MKVEQKNEIITLASSWMEDKGMAQADLAKHAKINPGYLSNMLRNNYRFEGTEIADRWFIQLANAIGHAVTKQYWGTIQTKEFEIMLHELRVAKNNFRITTIINETGLGKTYTVTKFCQVNPMHTYKVTVNSMYRVRDILNDLALALGTPQRTYALDTMHGIGRKLRELKMQGHHPLIILDEAENLKLPVLQMLKGLIDFTSGYSSIVMIGTNQLTSALERLARSDKQGVPQFIRRIKAGIRNVPAINDFTPFYKQFSIEDKGLKALLNSICNNYGELHDYLEPAMKEADEQGQPLTEDFFRIMYNMPKFK